jgi:hypothetical protein
LPDRGRVQSWRPPPAVASRLDVAKREERSGPYGSALDLPSVAQMLERIEAMKLLTRFVARGERKTVLELEQGVREIAARVDAFYALLGERNWIYHDSLHAERVAAITELSADDAEAALIDLYRDADWLRFMVRQLSRFDQMLTRMELLEKAQDDYLAGRHYATVLVLIAVMDGFVNDLEAGNRRGLHAREADELAAWDSVVGHHMGLTRAHATFTKSFFKTSTEPVHELYRNGIVHGTLLNFDNPVVSTKAWNRLFAVGDWAASLEREAAEPAPEPSWRETLATIAATARSKRASAAWRPRTLTVGDRGFDDEPVSRRTREFLDLWKAANYGRMTEFISPRAVSEMPRRMAGSVREMYSLFELRDYRIESADFVALAACVVEVELIFDDGPRRARIRWIRERLDGAPVADDDGEWLLYMWGPWAFFQDARA